MTLGKIERFWKTIWKEFLEEALFASFADASQRIAHWIAFYNHQRPHQGIGGACPADRFYGLAEDIEEATRQGCKENALRLALGQETKPPLYLLGKLGSTDVRVTRKGDDIEIKLGDTIHEVIRMGEPYRVDIGGHLYREEARDEVEGTWGRGEVPGTGAGAQGGDSSEADLRDLWGQPPGIEPCDGEGGSGLGGGPDEQIPAILREIAEEYHPEGFTDNSWSGLGRGTICYCANCSRKFLKRSAKDIPRAKDWNDPTYREWIRWNYDRRLEIWDLNNRATEAAGGLDCIWAGMNSGSIGGQCQSFRDCKAICERADIIMLDHQARSDASGFQHNGEAGKLIHGLLGWDKLIPESMAMYQAGKPTFRLAIKPPHR